MLELDELLEIMETVMDTEIPLSAEMAFESIPEWDSVNAMRLFTQLNMESEKNLSLKHFLEAKTINDVHQLLSAV